jgi:hypothetical protein
MTGAAPSAHQSVVVRDGRIAAVAAMPDRRVNDCRAADGVPRAALFFMIPVWLSLYSSEASTLAATGRFAQASSHES